MICFAGKVSWRNELPLRANTMFSLSNAIFFCKRMQSFSEKINTFASEGIHLQVNAKFLGETQYFCERVQMCANT